MPSSPNNNPIKDYVLSQLAKVMTSCIVLRISDFIVHRVTTNNKQSPREFMKGKVKFFFFNLIMFLFVGLKKKKSERGIINLLKIRYFILCAN